MSSRRSFSLLSLVFTMFIVSCSVSSDGQWSHVQEWTMFQGNSLHTGYVPVELDVQNFREQFFKVVLPGDWLNPITCGDGEVFVTSREVWGKKALYAFSAENGTLEWKHDFGDIDFVYPPAYADGKIFFAAGVNYENSFFYAIDISSKSIVFQTAYLGYAGTPTMPSISGGTLYFRSEHEFPSPRGVEAIRQSDGQRLWFTGTYQGYAWTPAADASYIYDYSADADLAKLTVINCESGDITFEIPDSFRTIGSEDTSLAPTLGSLNNILVTSGGRLISFDLIRRVVGWEIQEDFKGEVTLRNGVAYIINGDHIEARAETDGSLQWMWEPPDINSNLVPLKPMIVTDNILFVSCGDPTAWAPSGFTYAVSLQSHETVWTYWIGGYMALGKKGILFIATDNGLLAGINLK
jgi:outer membrane protein assembly factor BamB